MQYEKSEDSMAVFSRIQSRVMELAHYTDELSRQMNRRPRNKLQRQALPPIWYSECQVHCGHRRVTMSQRPLLFKLFKAFIDAPGHTIGRHELLAAVYPAAGSSEVSKQLIETHAHNLVKLLGRGRDVAESSLGGEPDLRWFVYDLRNSVWSLRETRHEPRQ